MPQMPAQLLLISQLLGTYNCEKIYETKLLKQERKNAEICFSKKKNVLIH